MTIWNEQLADQLDSHWGTLLRPRLNGLSDEEYFWEPVADCWSVRPRGTGTAPIQAGAGDFTVDFAFPGPTPAPVTTIAWRIAHLLVGVLGMRVASHFAGPAMDYETYDYPGSSDEALARLDAGYAAWIEGVRGLGEPGLQRACGPAEGPYAQAPMSTLVLHIHREVIHHGAEICLLRDLFAHRS
jgi:hypothetical protein